MAKPFTDEFNIGQAKVAQIRLEMGAAEMAEHYMGAFDRGYVPSLCRAMHRRLFMAGRVQYERAKAILEGLK